MKKLLLIYHTLRHVKTVQLYYQVWYRLKNKLLRLSWYDSYDNRKLHAVNASTAELLVISRGKYLGENIFRFLNLEHSFETTIDWNFMGFGKLWNYNLQYFDFLLDERISVAERARLLKCFSAELLAGRIRPEPYPVSLRLVNSILFLSRHQVEDQEIRIALMRQVRYLERNLEYHLLANHLLENLFALVVAAVALRDRSLFHKSGQLLKKELEEQVLQDGAHYECSPMYHSIILSKLLLAVEVAGVGEYRDDMEFFRNVASRMLGWIMVFSFPDGSWALMNDASEHVAPSTCALLQAAQQLNIPVTDLKLSDSGYRKLKGRDWEILIDTGNIIPSYQPGHAHADMLSFCVWYGGRQIICDTGTSTYENNARRMLERSTASHNTITFKSESQSRVWGSFRMAERASVTILQEANGTLEAEHDGYIKQYNTYHRRKFIASSTCLLVSDYLSHTGSCAAVGHLHFAAGVNILQQSKNEIVVDGLIIKSSAPMETKKYFVANQFNILQESTKVVFKVRNCHELKITFS